MRRFRLTFFTVLLFLSWTTLASAEMLALLNYESKPGQPVRREGIAIMDIDPDSADFGKILMEIPLPSDLVAHHIFFNRDRSKAYITALGKSLLHVVDLTRFPYRLRAIEVPDCLVGEDLVVSEDNRTWYLTCMGSSTVIMGDAVTDRPAGQDRARGVPGGGVYSVSPRNRHSQRDRPGARDQLRQAGYVGDRRVGDGDRSQHRTRALDAHHRLDSFARQIGSGRSDVQSKSRPSGGAHHEYDGRDAVGRGLGSGEQGLFVSSGR